MDLFLQELARYEAGGLTVLEWCGVVAIGGIVLATLAILVARLMGFSADIGIRYRKERPKAPPARAGREKILVVDDDPAVREMMNRLLGKLGYIVVEVGSGEQAVDYIKKNGANLLLMDSLMEPGIDGTETCRRIRQIRPLQRIIMISGYASPEKVAAVRSLGVEHYLIKPVSLAMLAQTIRTELDRP